MLAWSRPRAELPMASGVGSEQDNFAARGEPVTAADPRLWMWAEACAMIQRAEQLHRQFFQPGLDTPAANWEPPVDIFEGDHTLTILAALPGVEPADITIALDAGLVQITGIRRVAAAARGTAILRLEIPHGRFERRIRLPDARWRIESSALENGCLALSLTRAANPRFAER